MDIKMHDVVIVPEPNDTDIHNHEFIGTVVHIYPDGNMTIVEDFDGDCFDIEISRLILHVE